MTASIDSDLWGKDSQWVLTDREEQKFWSATAQEDEYR
jgi:hypothetical protein